MTSADPKFSGRRTFLKGLGISALLPVISGIPESLGQPSSQSTAHRILCCNIRVALDEDEAKGVGWNDRKRLCINVIKKRNPDIICLQEVLKVQSEDFRAAFTNHALFGFDGPEMDAHQSGYHGIAKNPILYSLRRYELLAAGTYWLSETPLVAGSKSWDTARARHANWIRLREKKSGKELRVINIHLDHVSGKAKIEQARMVVEESAQYQPTFPQIFTGDFNARITSRVFDSLREKGWKDTYQEVHGVEEPGHTGHAFKGVDYERAALGGKIDFIFSKGPVKATAAEIIKDQEDGRYPSDHFFVAADVEI